MILKHASFKRDAFAWCATCFIGTRLSHQTIVNMCKMESGNWNICKKTKHVVTFWRKKAHRKNLANVVQTDHLQGVLFDEILQTIHSKSAGQIPIENKKISSTKGRIENEIVEKMFFFIWKWFKNWTMKINSSIFKKMSCKNRTTNVPKNRHRPERDPYKRSEEIHRNFWPWHLLWWPVQDSMQKCFCKDAKIINIYEKMSWNNYVWHRVFQKENNSIVCKLPDTKFDSRKKKLRFLPAQQFRCWKAWRARGSAWRWWSGAHDGGYLEKITIVKICWLYLIVEQVLNGLVER